MVKLPPDDWLKDPDPVVARLPETKRSTFEKLIAGPATVRL
jgi:hypothetical protein